MALPAKLISGGQTGADLGGLRAGLILGIPTGGLMPRNFRTELGPRPWYDKQFGMTEHPSPDYGPRTIENVKAADVTIVFGSWRDAGSAKTLNIVRTQQKVLVVNPSVDQLRALLVLWREGTIANIAGNRESTNRGIGAYVTAILVDAWAPLMDAEKRKVAPYPRFLPKLPPWWEGVR